MSEMSEMTEIEPPSYTEAANGDNGHQVSLVTRLINEEEKPNTYLTEVEAPTASVEPQTGGDERETWGKNFEFLLSVIGFAVDLGNVWRFPYICYANGGGAFLIPYFIMYIFGGLPLFYLELALGQFQRCGCITVWSRICPIFKGIGFSICLISFYVSIYYNTVIAWALYYLFSSFKKELPWKSCKNAWNTENCVELADVATNRSNVSEALRTSGAQEFFNREVLEIQRSVGLAGMGNIKWSIALCLLAVFVIVYFSLWKGIKSSGKAVWFTAIFPYAVLLILLIRGVTLEGASKGILFYLRPQWKHLCNYDVWIEAAAQVFFSLGPGFGVLLALSSYNRFRNNCYRDALITSSINCLTSFLAGFVVFSGIGYMAVKMNIEDVGSVATQGPGLVFEVYPEVIAQLPASQFFAVIFFLMLITLGLDSTFGGLEALITGVLDEWGWLKKKREFFVAGLLACCFIGSLATTTYGGKYLVQFLDKFAAPVPILSIVFLESVAVSWFYGFLRFSRDIEMMLGFQPGIFWKACWVIISPLFLLTLFIMSFWKEIGEKEIIIGGHTYPWWSYILAWAIKTSSHSCVIIVAVYKIATANGNFVQRIKQVITPEEEPEIPEESLSPVTPDAKV